MNTDPNLQKLRAHYSWILSGGAKAGAGLLVIGMILKFFTAASGPDVTSYLSASPWTTLPRALHLDGDAFQLLGILVLIVTPVIRVLWSVVLYLRDRELLMVFFAGLSLLFITAGVVAKL